MVLKVIGAGFGRTGTHSVKHALEILGLGPCHHMSEVRRSVAQIEMWRAISNGEQADWEAVFSGFDSQMDWPAAAYWRELTVAYPSAKVILTDRDPEAWYESIRKTILPATKVGRLEDPDASGRAGSEIIYRIALQGIFGDRLEDKGHAISVFRGHRQEVIDSIAPERLIVFRVDQGWEPLCSFLGVPVPAAKFPTDNSTSEFLARKPFLNGALAT